MSRHEHDAPGGLLATLITFAAAGTVAVMASWLTGHARPWAGALSYTAFFLTVALLAYGATACIHLGVVNARALRFRTWLDSFTFGSQMLSWSLLFLSRGVHAGYLAAPAMTLLVISVIVRVVERGRA